MKGMVMHRTIKIAKNKYSVGRQRISSATVKIEHIGVFKSKGGIPTIIISASSKVRTALGLHQSYILLGEANNASTTPILDSKRRYNFQHIAHISMRSTLCSWPPLKKLIEHRVNLPTSCTI